MAAKKKSKVSLFERIRKKLRKRLKEIGKFIGYKWILPIYYRHYTKKPLDEKKVVFADFRDREMPDNFLSLYELCKKAGYTCIVLSGKPFGKNVPKWIRRKEKIKFHFAFIRLYAQCRAVFLVEYFPLAYIVNPRVGTDVVQLWHGCGVMKKIGYSAQGKKWGASEKEKKRYPMHTTYTIASASSYRAKEAFEDAFRCDPQIIQPLGVPRTDIYYDETFRAEAKIRVHQMFPEIGNRKIILYAPTFRGRSISKSYIDCKLDYHALNEALSKEYVFLIKFHPMMAKGGLTDSVRINNFGFVLDATHKLGAEEALCVADILVTDYSSIMFEYLLLERPIISFIYDIDEYVKDRGLYAPYEQLAPGPYVFDSEELLEKLESVNDWFDIERIRRYRKEFMSACDGHSTERIFQTVFKEASLKELGGQA